MRVVIMSDKSLGYKGRGWQDHVRRLRPAGRGYVCWAETGAWFCGHWQAHGVFDRDLLGHSVALYSPWAPPAL